MGLNDQQLKAATSEAESILCLAGAGAGKTKTLLARIEHLTKKGVDPKSMSLNSELFTVSATLLLSKIRRLEKD